MGDLPCNDGRPGGWGSLKRDWERRGFEEAALRAAILLGAASASPVAPTAPPWRGPVTRPRWAILQASTALSSPAGSAARPLRGDRAAPALRAAIHRGSGDLCSSVAASWWRPRSRRRTGRRAGSPSGVARRPGRRRPRSPQPGQTLLIRRYIFRQRRDVRCISPSGNGVSAFRGVSGAGRVQEVRCR